MNANYMIQQNTNQLTTISNDLFKSFINYIDASKKTVETYTRALRQFAKYLLNNGITQPTREDILNYRDELKETRKPSTVQAYITVVRLFFQWTEQQSLYPNVAQHIKGAKLSKDHKKDYLTSSQVKSIIKSMNHETLEDKRNYAIFLLMVTGGLRTIEVSRANIEDLGTQGNSTVLYIQGKGKEEKTDYVKLAPQVETAIREYLKERGNACLSDPLFASTSNNSKGNRLSTRTISGIVKKLFKSNGYDSERLTAHSTRHTAVTLALLGGQDIQSVQQFARHTNVATTLIYAHNLDKASNKCESVIANSIF